MRTQTIFIEVKNPPVTYKMSNFNSLEDSKLQIGLFKVDLFNNGSSNQKVHEIQNCTA